MTPEMSLEKLTARLDALEGENARLREEIDALRSDQSPAKNRTSQTPQGEANRNFASRRMILRTAFGLAAATGAGALLQSGAAQASGTEGPTSFIGTAPSTPAVRATGINGAKGIVASSDTSDGISATVGASTSQAALRGTASNGAVGVVSTSSGGYGVYATSDVTAIFGESNRNDGLGIGVEGFSATGVGVVGQGGTLTTPNPPSNTGVYAHGTSGYGVYATSDSSDAIYASASGGTVQAAVRGVAANGGDGIVGSSDRGYGVYGTTGAGTGTFGSSTDGNGQGIGVEGFAASGIGVVAQSGTFTPPTLPSYTGLYAHGTTGNGVYAVSDTADGLYASGASGRGGVFSGGAAAINLAPSTAPTHPASGEQGDLFVDSSGRLWFCRIGGSSATWIRLA